MVSLRTLQYVSTAAGLFSCCFAIVPLQIGHGNQTPLHPSERDFCGPFVGLTCHSAVHWHLAAHAAEPNALPPAPAPSGDTAPHAAVPTGEEMGSGPSCSPGKSQRRQRSASASSPCRSRKLLLHICSACFPS